MSRYSDTDTYSQAGDWLMGTARRHPEALLLLAAGACLLMRSGGSSPPTRGSQSRFGDEGYQAGSSRVSSNLGRASSNVREGLSQAAESASDYASQVKDRVSEAAGSYADSVSEFAQDARRNISDSSARLTRHAQSTLQSGMDRVLSDQPLAVAIAGFAAGAAVAAVFPSTAIEDRTLSGAREALTEAAGKAGERVMGAAGKVGERLKSAAEERGLTSEGLKEVAGEVADTFSNAVAGKSTQSAGGATKATESPKASSNPGQASSSPGQDFQNKPAPNRSPNIARSDFEPGQGNR